MGLEGRTAYHPVDDTPAPVFCTPKLCSTEKALFDELLSWLAQRRSALTRILNVRTDMFDGFLLFADEIEKKMAA